ncbi:MAG: competence/damage-inducible protein A [candidate division WOR-3 bacterium]
MTNCEILIVGNNIITGRIPDTNSNFLAKKLFELGINLVRITTISDNKAIIEATLKEVLSRSDLVFIAGGLGPTPDDNTVAVAAKIFNQRLILDESLLAQIEKYYAKINKPMPEAQTRQALVPQGAIVLENPVGTAPGLILKQANKVLILLPGSPTELEKIFLTGVIPYLESTFSLTPLYSKVIRTTNITQAEIFEKVARYFVRHKGIEITYLTQPTGVDIVIWTDRDKKLLTACEKEIVARVKPYVYGFDTTTIEETVGQILKKKNLTLATAESCTAGLIADRITNVPGSSGYFIGGVVAYSNEIKKAICRVQPETLKKFGAVSKETALEMATGIKENYKTDIGLSVTGICGPTGGTKTKPVGLVYLGIATKSDAKYEERIFFGNRRLIKEQSAMAALDFLRRTLESG